MADIDYKTVVNFSNLKSLITEKRTTVKYLSEDVGLTQANLSAIITGWRFPKTDIIARLAWKLGVQCSEIVELKEIEPNSVQADWFSRHERKYKVPENATGILTYEPLWELVKGFLEEKNKGNKEGERLFTADDLLDSIEPYRRRNGLVSGLSKENLKKSLKARGIDENHISPRERHYKAKGLTPEIRTKLRKDRPLTIRTVYDICKKLGCSIDWVLSYK